MQASHSQPKIKDRLTQLRAYFAEEVTREWGDLVLTAECFATGLLDSAAFNVWSCFVSMQTGNTVYVGLGASGQPFSQPWRWAKSGTSILSFIIGSFLFSRLMRRLGPLKRSTVVLATGLQALLTILAALSSTVGLVPRDAGNLPPYNWIVLLPLALLAAQAGGQCVLSRVLEYNEMPTVVLTSSYCDLAMDAKLFTGLMDNSKRNRRLASVSMIIAGAVVGGFLTKGGDIGAALWLGGAIKVVLAAVWMGWKAEAGAIALN